MGILTTDDMKAPIKKKGAKRKMNVKIIDKYKFPGVPAEAERSFFYYNKEARSVELEGGYVKFPKFDDDSKKKEFIKMIKAAGFIDESDVEMLSEIEIEKEKNYEYTLLHPDAGEKPITLSFDLNGIKIEVIDNIAKTKNKEIYEYLRNKEYTLIKKEEVNE